MRYLKASGLSKGYLLIFDERPDQNPIIKESGEVVEIPIGDKLLRIYWIGVQLDAHTEKPKKRQTRK